MTQCIYRYNCGHVHVAVDYVLCGCQPIAVSEIGTLVCRTKKHILGCHRTL